MTRLKKYFFSKIIDKSDIISALYKEHFIQNFN